MATILAAILGVGIIAFATLQSQASTAVAGPLATTPPALEHDRQLGAANAPVTLDVWSDFQCPYCRAFWTQSEPELVTNYVATGKVRLVYHDYPIIGPESLDAAVAARCADRQSKFWAYHALLYANQGSENSGAFSQDRLLQLARAAGLDVSAFTSCLGDPSVSQSIQQEAAAGAQLNMPGTPSLFANGKLVPGFDYPTVASAIDAALASAAAPAAPAASPEIAAGSPAGITPPSAAP